MRDICPSRDDAQPHFYENGRCALCYKLVPGSRIYFVAQTGVITRSPPSVSNFYVYELRREDRYYVESEVEKAKVESGGLVYEAPFLEWLAVMDLKDTRPYGVKLAEHRKNRRKDS